MILRMTLGVGLLLAALAGTAAAQRLTVTSWGGAYQNAQREAFFAPFMIETGVILTEAVWNGGIGALRDQVAGGSPDWDVVEVRSDELALGCAEGLFEPIDYGAIGGEDQFVSSAVHECGVGNVVWSLLIAYDGAVLGQDPPQSWADFWDTERFPGRRALRRGPQFTLESALLADGVPPEDVYDVLRTPEGVDRAFAKLDELGNDLVWWEDGAEPLTLLANGEVVMTATYNGRIATTNRSTGRDLRPVWPGSLYTLDSWVILRGSSRIEEAYKFIAFVSEAERQAHMSMLIPYGVTNRNARALIDPITQANLPTSPERLAVSLQLDTAFWAENIDPLTERFERWLAE